MKFKLSAKFVIDSEKEPWSIEGLRVGFFGGSGSGKSWSATLLVEQWLTQGGTVVIFEPRAEYQTLKEKFDVLVVGGPFGKDVDFVPAVPSAFAHAIVNEGVSIVFYTSDVEDEEKLIEFVRRLIGYILKYNEVVKRPVLLVIEEAQEYAPHKTSGRDVKPWVYARMIRAFKNCFEQGRKLNVSTIALSPRPQGVDFTIRQLANLSFYGKFSPQDIGYIDRECLKVYRERGIPVNASGLLDLGVSEWLVIHGKKAEYIKVTEERLTPHGAVTPRLKYEVPKKERTRKTMNELVQTIEKALEQERLEESEVGKLKRKVGELEQTLRERDDELKKVNTALEVASRLEIKAPEAKVDVDAIRKEVVLDLRDKVLGVFDSLTTAVTVESVQKKAADKLYETWAHKLPTLPAKRIFKLLVENAGIKFTISEIGLKLGYKSTTGSFRSALSTLKRNSLVKFDGSVYWCE